MKKTFLSVAIVLGSTMLLSGCETLSVVNDKLDNALFGMKSTSYSNVVDKELVDFYYDEDSPQRLNEELRDEGYLLSSLKVDAMVIDKQIKSLSNMQQAINFMSQYSSDAETDIIAVKYIDAAKSRNNTIKVYRPKLTAKVNSFFGAVATPNQKSREWYDLDRLLIEFDSNDRPKSMIVRSYQATTTVGVILKQHSRVLFGDELVRLLEDRIVNSEFEENFIREIK